MINQLGTIVAKGGHEKQFKKWIEDSSLKSL